MKEENTQNTKVHTLTDILFYCLDSYEVTKNGNGKVICQRKMEGFPNLDKIGNCIPKLKGMSKQEILTFFEQKGNEVLYEHNENTSMYSVLGIKYTAFGNCSQKAEEYHLLKEAVPEMSLADLAEGIDRFTQGQGLLELSQNTLREIIRVNDGEIIITLEKYCALQKPDKIVLDKDGEVR